MKHTAGGIILKDKKLLLIKRSNYTTMFPGCWTVPSGRGEIGEIPLDTAIREVYEEVGLTFEPTELFHTSTIEHSGERHQTYRYLGRYTGDIHIQESEADGYAWFSYDETLHLDIAFDYREVIERLYHTKYLA